jgi:hypothetical protein
MPGGLVLVALIASVLVLDLAAVFGAHRRARTTGAVPASLAAGTAVPKGGRGRPPGGGAGRPKAALQLVRPRRAAPSCALRWAGALARWPQARPQAAPLG